MKGVWIMEKDGYVRLVVGWCASFEGEENDKDGNYNDKNEMNKKHKRSRRRRKKVYVDEIALDFNKSEIHEAKTTPMVELPGGTFDFGSQFHFAGDRITSPKVLDGARPRRKVTVKPFLIDEDVVTNAQFARFVAETDYKTESEEFGWSFVFEAEASKAVAEECDQNMGRVKDAQHWMAVKRATWAHPHGPDTTFHTALDLPVVQVSYNDADAYCHHIGKRLPFEKEWEFAARGGLVNKTYHWGDDHTDESYLFYNGWQGKFPKENTAIDGYRGLSPVKAFLPNDYGIYGMLGNVWEWVRGKAVGDVRKDKELSPKEKRELSSQRVLRGGSFVDTSDGSFNHIISVSTRQENSMDSAANNVGFRCALSLKDKTEL